MDLDSAREMLEKLAETYPKEYNGLQMPYIAMTTVVPLLKARLQSWNCLAEPHLYIEEFLQWRSILRHNPNEHRQTDPMTPYHTLLWESWMPAVRLFSKSTYLFQHPRLSVHQSVYGSICMSVCVSKK